MYPGACVMWVDPVCARDFASISIRVQYRYAVLYGYAVFLILCALLSTVYTASLY